MTMPTVKCGDDDEVKGDLTPMIDIIFLLLIFFILTTTFVSPEKVISALLPDKGQDNIVGPLAPDEPINVCILPEGLPEEARPSELQAAWQGDVAGLRRTALLRVGRRGSAVRIDGLALASPDPARSGGEVARVVAHLATELGRREAGAGTPRRELPPVVIHCFSGLSWMYALAAYDGVRAFEAGLAEAVPERVGPLTAEELYAAREVDFAPPRLRHVGPHPLGDELWEIMRLR